MLIEALQWIPANWPTVWTALQQQYIDYWGCDAVYRMDSDHGVPCAAPIELAFILHDIAGERWRERVHETEIL